MEFYLVEFILGGDKFGSFRFEKFNYQEFWESKKREGGLFQGWLNFNYVLSYCFRSLMDNLVLVVLGLE